MAPVMQDPVDAHVSADVHVSAALPTNGNAALRKLFIELNNLGDLLLSFNHIKDPEFFRGLGDGVIDDIQYPIVRNCIDTMSR